LAHTLESGFHGARAEINPLSWCHVLNIKTDFVKESQWMLFLQGLQFNGRQILKKMLGVKEYDVGAQPFAAGATALTGRGLSSNVECLLLITNRTQYRLTVNVRYGRRLCENVFHSVHSWLVHALI
jgi:hypothetical protein